MELSKELREQIEKQLPGMFASEMQSFISQAKNDAAEVVLLNGRLADAKRDRDAIKADLDKHRPLAEREAAVAKRESDAQAKELDLLKREAQIDAKIAQAELTGVKDTQKLFLANVTLRQSIMESTHAVLPGFATNQNGYNQVTMPTTMPVHNSTMTTTEQA